MHRNPLASASSVLGLKGCATTSSFILFSLWLSLLLSLCLCKGHCVQFMESLLSSQIYMGLRDWTLVARLAWWLPLPTEPSPQPRWCILWTIEKERFYCGNTRWPFVFISLLRNCWVIFNLELLWGFPYKPFFGEGACFDFAQVNV